MKKLCWALLLAISLVGCSKRSEPLVIKNDCKGAWLVVAEGNGAKLIDRLEPGAIKAVDVEGYRDTTIYLIASGYEVGTNRNLGTATTQRYIPRNGYLTGPDQLQPWVINYLSFTDFNGGCGR